MSIQEIKDQLPTVKVLVGETVVEGAIAGRLEKFPKMFFKYYGTTLSGEFSWQAIQRSVNSGLPLVYST